MSPSLAQENCSTSGRKPYQHSQIRPRDRFETRLSFNAKEIRLELEDDGNGFRTNGRHDGFGLIGMRERVAQLSGSLRIASARGKGTKIVVVIPEQSTSP